MKKQVLRLIVCATAALSLSCVPESGSGAAVFITQVLTPLNVNGVCTFAVGGPSVANGVLDVSFQGNYQAGLEVHTNLAATFRNQTINNREIQQPSYPNNYGQGNSNVVIVQSAEVAFSTDVLNDQGQPTPIAGLPNRSSAAGAVVFNENQGTDAATNVLLDLVTLNEAAELSGQVPNAGDELRIITTVQLQAQTSGGGTVTSPSFSFPITVCNGCLAAPDVCPDGNPPVANGAACNLGQDVAPLICE